MTTLADDRIQELFAVRPLRLGLTPNQPSPRRVMVLTAGNEALASQWRAAIESQIEALQSAGAVRREGRLLKHWKGTHSHHRQYFVLDSNGLKYDDVPEATSGKVPKGFVALKGAHLLPEEERENKKELHLVIPEPPHSKQNRTQRVLVLTADSFAEAKEWREHIQAEIEMASR